MALRRLAVITLVLAAGWIVAAHAPGQDKQQKKDPQSIYEPPSKPGMGQKFLEKFVGDWDVEKTFSGGMGEGTKTKGTCKQTMQQDGRFLYSEFTFGEGMSKTTGLGIVGYEPDSGIFSSVWIDSRQTKMSLRQSREKFDGTKIVLYAGSLKDSSKQGTRTITVLEDDGKKIIHRQFNKGQDGNDRLFMELLMTKKTNP